MLPLSYLSQISHETIYVALSAVIAVIIFLEGQALKKTSGKIPESTLFHIGSVTDTLWFFISVASCYYLTFQSIAICVPIAYALYTLFGWFYGISLMRKNGIPDDPEDLVIPPSLIAYNQSFALIFFILCLVVLFSPCLIAYF